MVKSASETGNLFIQFMDSVQVYLPRILAALILLLAGGLVSWLLGIVVSRLISRFSRWSAVRTGLQDSGVGDFGPRAGYAIAFWVSFLLFIASAGQVLGLQAVTGSLSRLAAYLPNLLAAVVVVIAGILLGNLARAGVDKAARAARLSRPALYGESARITVLILAAMVALGQAGIDSTVLVLAFGLVLGGAIGGMALAFGFGARTTVSNLLASRHISRSYQTGQLIRIGGQEGRIVLITQDAVILQTSAGRARIPAKQFEEQTAVLLDEKD